MIVTIAAWLYGIAYWYPLYCWWGTLASMVLIMRVSASPRTFFWYGIGWALIAYGMHTYGIICGIAGLAARTIWYAWLPGIVVFAYLVLMTGFFWMVGAWCEQLWCRHRIHCCAVRAGWFSCYWLYMTYGMLWPAGRWEGCLLLHPLIPWAQYQCLMLPVAWFGVICCTVLVCGIAALISLSWDIVACRWHCCVGCVAALAALWGAVYYSPSSDNGSGLLFAHVPHVIRVSPDRAALCRLMHDYVVMAAQGKQNILGAVFPESAVYAWDLCAMSLLAAHAPRDGFVVHDYIIGSFYDEYGIYRNSCYWIHDGVMQQRFDKRHAMPLIERMPWWLKSNGLQQLFFAYMPEIVPSCNERPIMQLGTLRVVPYICSELFCNRLPDDMHHEVPIIALVNDRWCGCAYVQQLMYLGAVLQAYAWQRDIVYAAYSRCVYIRSNLCLYGIVLH